MEWRQLSFAGLFSVIYFLKLALKFSEKKINNNL